MKVIELSETSELPDVIKRRFPHPNPRPYQADIAGKVYESLSNGSKVVLLEGPTGLGKRL